MSAGDTIYVTTTVYDGEPDSLEQYTYAGAIMAERMSSTKLGSASLSFGQSPAATRPSTSTSAAGVACLGTSPAVKQCVLVPTTSGTLTVRARADGEEVYDSKPIKVSGLNLKCPASVERGKSATCVASGGTITGWKFEGTVNGTSFSRARTTNQTSTTWSGEMAVSGTVTVNAAGGGSASKTIDVTSRTWDSTQVPHVVKDLGVGPASTGLVLKDPATSLAQLGRTVTTYTSRLGRFTLIGDGPNTNITYAKLPPVDVESEVLINRAALKSTSVWMGWQPATRSGTDCSKADVAALVPSIEQHEGSVPNRFSHVSTTYSSMVDGLVSFFESFARVGPVDPSEVHRTIAILKNIASSNSRSITDNSYGNPFQPTCNFRFTP